MKIESWNEGELALVKVHEGFWERMSEFPVLDDIDEIAKKRQELPIEGSWAWKCGWRRSTTPHMLVLADWGEHHNLLGITLSGPLAKVCIETRSALKALEYGRTDEILDTIKIAKNPEAQNFEKFDSIDYARLVNLIRDAEQQEVGR